MFPNEMTQVPTAVVSGLGSSSEICSAMLGGIVATSKLRTSHDVASQRSHSGSSCFEGITLRDVRGQGSQTVHKLGTPGIFRSCM